MSFYSLCIIMKNTLVNYTLKLLVIVCLVMIASYLNATYASDRTDTEHFSSNMEKSMFAIDQKMRETELCFENIGTRNPIICSIWEQNIATPFI